MAKLHLHVEEFVAVKKALSGVPNDRRDPHHVAALRGVNKLLRMVKEKREGTTDERGVEDIRCHICKAIIGVGDDYVFEGMSGKCFHPAPCWLERK